MLRKVNKKEPKIKETKAERFARILPKRIAPVELSLVRLSNMGNKFYFEYTPEQAQEIVDKLEVALENVKKAFNV